MVSLNELEQVRFDLADWYGTKDVKIVSVGVREDYIERILLDLADQLLDHSSWMEDSIINVHSIGVRYRRLENEMVVTFMGTKSDLVVKLVDFRSEYDYLIASVYTC